MSSSTTFSYAQAAKGQLAAQPAASLPTPEQSQASSVAGSQSRDANTSTGTRDPSVAVSTTTSVEPEPSRSVRSDSVKPNARASEPTETNKDEGNTTASVAGSLDSAKVVPNQPSTDGPIKGMESRGRSTHAASDATEQNDGKKSRKPRKGKSTEKDPETEVETPKAVPQAKVELAPAPIPTVNPWHARQQAQQAKVAEQSSQTSTSGASASQTSTEPKARPSHGEAAEGTKIPANGRHGSRRDGDFSQNAGAKRTGPRGARGQDKQTETTLAATNPASWPTPDTVTNNSKTQQPAVPEKPEKVEKDDVATSKPKQKEKWVQLPNFVPSVKFETALPGRGRGGRVGGSRGGRDVAGGNHNANSADRTQEANSGPRSSSGPKRGHGEGVHTREGRKNAVQAEHSKAPKDSVSDNTGAEQAKPGQSGIANGTTQEHSAGQASNSSRQPDESGRHFDSHRDIRTQSSKDGHHQGQNGSSHRGNDRTRGGGRGRGGSNHNSTNGLSHHGQAGFSAPHQSYQFQPNGSRPVAHYSNAGYQMPYQYAAQPGANQRRPANGNRRHGSARAPGMVPMGIPYDPSMYVPPAGVYTYEPNHVFSLAQSQIEYYFSVDNCVKDWYLRKHMDSQGFVPISFIAGFNRMRELTVDTNVIRQACADSALLEFVMGNDGVERVRAREGWEKWVIQDMSLRDPSARHPGPSSWQQFSGLYQPQMMSPPYGGEVPQVFSPTNEHGFGQYANMNYGLPPLSVPVTNGVNGHATRPHESQLSAAVPEFSPSGTPASNGPETGLQNGGAAEVEVTASMQPNSETPRDTSSSVNEHQTNGVSAGIEAH
ncbi:hypothetical protein F5Y17DRAFT_399427 [Xylariaceae sp. FL0594]|nr:hypothetical protein F5Y17DRAFT_399427 [Xylariaceae sp. FL0594]